MRFFSFVVLLIALTVSFARAEETRRIAAVVNEEAISDLDLDARLRLIAFTANLRESTDVLQRMVPEILRTLIDERLKIQEASRLEIKVEDEELEAAKRGIESRNGIPEGTLDDALRTEGIPPSTIATQIRASLAWEKIVRNQLYPRVSVSEDEVDEHIVRQKQYKGTIEYLVSDIFMAVGEAADEDAVFQTVKRVAEASRTEGNFERFAQEFSQSITALSGGDLGWVREGQLANKMDEALHGMKGGDISDPIRTEDGYHILWLRDQRHAGEAAGSDSVSLSQILFPLKPAAPQDEVAAAMTKAQNERKNLSGCAAMNRAAELLKTPMSGHIGTMSVSDLPFPLREPVRQLPVGQPSEPLQTESGIHLLMVCDRPDSQGPTEDRQQVQLNLLLEKLDLLARRYLRDLRQTAFVDIRL